VFMHNMREPGHTGVQSHLLCLILDAFPAMARLIIVTGEDTRPLAGGFVLDYRDRLEVPWASSLRVYNHLQSNMWLYWQ
jgi:serine/alanine adding enzyme